MPFISPFAKRERALPTIGNERGSTENKNFPVAQNCALNRLEFHYLDVRDSGYPYDCVRMDKPIGNSHRYDPFTDQVQHISPDHHHKRLSYFHDRTAIEPCFRRQFQPSLPERLAYTVLVTARHQQAFLGFVGRGVDEIQETLPTSSRLTTAHHTPRTPGKTGVPPGQSEYPAGDTPDR